MSAAIIVSADIESPGSANRARTEITVTSHGARLNPAPRTAISRLLQNSRPPRQPRGFLDREAELNTLVSELQPEHGAWLYGPPGCGLTFLLRRAANIPAAQELPDGAIYLDGETTFAYLAKVRSPDVSEYNPHLEDIVQHLFNLFYSDTTERAVRVTQGMARTYLSELKALFVLDRLPLTHDELILLADILAGGAVLVSANGPTPDTLANLPLGGLPRSDARKLCLAAAQIDIAQEGMSPLLERLCAALDDLPLPLLLAGYLLRSKLMTLAQLVGALNEPEILHEHTALARAARLVLRSLNDDQRDVLSALVHVGGPHADLATLAEVSGLPGTTVEAALTLLSQLRMIKAGTDRYAVGTASLRQILARLLPRSAERRRAAIFFAAAAVAHPGDLAWLERELGNLFAALKTALEQGMAPQVAALAQAVQPLLVLRGRWGGWGQVIDWARQAAQSSGDRALLAWALHEHGTRAGLLGDRASAAVNLTQARQLRLDLGDHGGATASQHNLEYLGLLPQSLDMNGRHKGGFLSKPWVVVVTLLALLFLSGGIVIAREIIAASEVTSSSIPTLSASIGTTSTPAPTRTSAQGSLAPTREASSGPVPSGATRPIARGDFQASGPTFSVSGPYMGGFLSEDSCAFYTAHGWNGDYYPPYMLWRSDQQSQFSVSADLRITDYAGPGTYKKERIDGAIALYINPGRVPVGYIGDDLTIIVNQDGSGKLTFSGTGSHSPGMVRGSMTWDCKDEMLDQEYFLEPFN